MEQKTPKFSLLKNNKSNVLFVSSVAVLLGIMVLMGGCATMDTITGKADLETGIASLEQQKKVLEDQKASVDQGLANCQAERAELEAKKADLEKQLETERASFAKREAEYKEKIKKLEISDLKGISVLFFGGDIIYEIMPEAFQDYRAGLRYRSLIDSDFASSFQKFEERKGGDSSVLEVLREIDTSDERVIDRNEAFRFRKAEEDKYGKKRTDAPGNYNPQ